MRVRWHYIKDRPVGEPDEPVEWGRAETPNYYARIYKMWHDTGSARIDDMVSWKATIHRKDPDVKLGLPIGGHGPVNKSRVRYILREREKTKHWMAYGAYGC